RSTKQLTSWTPSLRAGPLPRRCAVCPPGRSPALSRDCSRPTTPTSRPETKRAALESEDEDEASNQESRGDAGGAAREDARLAVSFVRPGLGLMRRDHEGEGIACPDGAGESGVASGPWQGRRWQPDTDRSAAGAPVGRANPQQRGGQEDAGRAP